MEKNKIFILVEEYNFDYEHECRVTPFSDKQDAYNALAAIKERELKESWIPRYDEEDLEVGCDDYDCFDIYLNGYASRYETSLRVVEKEIR